MKQAKGSHDKGGIGAASSSTSSMKYEGKNGIPYNYAMPWMMCHKCEKKGLLASNCSMKKTQSSSWKRKSAHRQYADITNRTKTAPRQYVDKIGRTWKKSSKVVQIWIKKSD